AAGWRSLAARAMAEAVSGPRGPGPVHLNLPFREPLVGTPSAVPPGRGGGAPWQALTRTPGAPPDELVAELVGSAGRRGLVVAGAGAGDPEDLAAMSAALGWPLLADPRSGARRAPGARRASGAGVVAAADAVLRSPAALEALRPEVVLRVGQPWVSKVVSSWLAGLDALQVLVDPDWAWRDPDRAAAVVSGSDPTLLSRALCRAARSGAGAARSGAGGAGAGSARGWCAAWAAAEEAAQSTFEKLLGGGAVSEPALARSLYGLLGDADRLVVASSMPVRDLEAYAAPGAPPPRVLANRGANGIDGTLATALGVAAGSPAGRTVALVGDLAFLHDAGSLLGARGVAAAAPAAGSGGCTIVVADNGGGGIFSFLDQAASLPAERFERLFGTPQDADVAEVAAGYRVPCTELTDLAELRGSLAGAGVTVVRARTGRAANARLHRELSAAAAEAVTAALRS
ncbi:MAG: 2-succinyl-5-enolpyruvyl-6-hydroxy-3-cyclohexene-1-carboxylate synthase, partial [Acidimicrobiales bacterium]